MLHVPLRRVLPHPQGTLSLTPGPGYTGPYYPAGDPQPGGTCPLCGGACHIAPQIEAARKAGELAQQSEPAARHARYNPVSREIEIELRDGRRVSISVDLIQGLQGASDEELSRVNVTPAGTGLYWQDLDVDISVPFLLKGIYGTRAWMAELGRRGG